jgi:sugar/nucleoside kinase (ribokinase family)
MLAALGPLALDAVAGTPRRPGGAVLYAARTFAHLGADARVAVSCAAADWPLLRPAIETLGLPVHRYASRSTAAFSFRYEGDERSMRQDAVADPWTPEEAVAAVGDAAWVHVGALVRSDFAPETLAALASGRSVLVDAQGLVRTPTLGPLRMDDEIGAALDGPTILKLNGEEAEILTGSTEPARLRELGVPEVLLTLGSRGAVVVTRKRAEAVPAVQVDGFLDPTGAGDVFAAAYLVARAGGAEPVEAARSAARAVAAVLGGG